MMDIDRIIASVPINSTTARVIGQRGEHYDVTIEEKHAHFEAPPPMRQVADDPLTAATAAAIVGKRFGRIVILGLGAVGRGGSHRARWVARCDCGGYTYFSAKAIRNGSATMCQKCNAFEKLKWQYENQGPKEIDGERF